MDRKKVLIIMNTVDAGGAETFIMKVFRVLNKEKYQFDFLINKKDSTFYKDEIRLLGGEIYYGYSKSKHPFKCLKTVYKRVKMGQYQRVFCIAVHPAGVLDVLAAKAAGAGIRLVRSTNSNAGGWFSSILAVACRPLLCYYATTMIAPSKEAARWLFGETAIKKGKVNIVHNAVDLNQFLFDVEVRKKIRSEFGIGDRQSLFGHVGRFNKQKNHLFLIEVFAEIKKTESDAVLFLIGDGELKHNIEKKVKELGLTNAVRFLGIRKDIPQLLMAMDLILFPSLYEGLPNVIVEAQATGLPCLISDSISKEVNISELVENESINSNPADWAEHAKIQLMKNRINVRTEAIRDLEKHGYSIAETVNQIEGYLR